MEIYHGSYFVAYRSLDMYVRISRSGRDMLAHEGSKRSIGDIRVGPTRPAVVPVTVAAVSAREGLFIGGLGLWGQRLLCILWGEETVSLFDDDM
jgi:hypothetical protein